MIQRPEASLYFGEKNNMDETSIPIKKMSFQSVAKEVAPTLEHQVTEDEVIATLSGNPAWNALKDRIQRKIDSAEASAKVTGDTIGLIDDVSLFGFKCMTKDLLVEAFQGIINDVELTAKYLKEKEDEQPELPTEESAGAVSE